MYIYMYIYIYIYTYIYIYMDTGLLENVADNVADGGPGLPSSPQGIGHVLGAGLLFRGRGFGVLRALGFFQGFRVGVLGL